MSVAAGTYPGQTFGGKPKGGASVVFQAAGAVTSGNVVFESQSGIEIDGMSVYETEVHYSSNITLRNLTQRAFFVRSSDHVSYLGGSIGDIHDGTSATIGEYLGHPASTNILVDGVSFHDMDRGTTSNHPECLFIQEANGVTVRNSSFARCEAFDVYANVLFGGSISNILFENNRFGVTSPTGYYAFRANVGSFTFRNNTFDQGMANDAPVTVNGCGNTVAPGNAFPTVLLQPC